MCELCDGGGGLRAGKVVRRQCLCLLNVNDLESGGRDSERRGYCASKRTYAVRARPCLKYQITKSASSVFNLFQYLHVI